MKRISSGKRIDEIYQAVEGLVKTLMDNGEDDIRHIYIAQKDKKLKIQVYLNVEEPLDYMHLDIDKLNNPNNI